MHGMLHIEVEDFLLVDPKAAVFERLLKFLNVTVLEDVSYHEGWHLCSGSLVIL